MAVHEETTMKKGNRKLSIINHQSTILNYHICPTEFGDAAITFETDPFLVKGVYLPRSRKKDLEERIRRDGPVKPACTKEALNVCKEIRAYFEGVPVKIPWGSLDFGGMSQLQYAVLRAVARVPYGQIRSYGQIAAQIKRPRAARFVGTTLSRNPFPIFIPCHRIVRADGSPGGFAGGMDLKQRMLLLEK
jgi:methylated-DNA-[protein]-cysteine S-methyltransferase